MFPRKITPLHEDMAKLGLTKLVNEDINRQPRAQPRRKPVTESRQQATSKQKQQLAEQRKQLAERSKRAKTIRESRMKSKTALYETRLQRIERRAKKANKKVESHLRKLKGLQKRAAVLESYDVRKQCGGKDPTAKQLAESFMKVGSLAGTLGRTFSVLENFFAEAEAGLGIPVIHPDSAYGYDTSSSYVGDGSHGAEDPIDYSGDAKQASEDDEEEPKDDMAEDDDDDMKDTDTHTEDEDGMDDDDDVTTEDEDGMDDDDKKTEDDDKDDDDVTVEDDDMAADDDEPKTEDDDDETKTEDEEPAAADADKKQEARRRKRRSESLARLPMDYELHAIRLEAEDMAGQVGGADQNVNMGYASTLLNDMVSYLGGAMKLYFKIQQAMQNFGYVGQDQPAAAGGSAPEGAHNDAYIGQAQPDGETAVGEGGAPNAPKTGDATDTSGMDTPHAESKQAKRAKK